jgi:hypothetical protein
VTLPKYARFVCFDGAYTVVEFPDGSRNWILTTRLKGGGK